ncbi:MAG: MBL fold metallo-hydrolase [Chloroflexota bacterium]
MIQISANVYVEHDYPVCNVGMVTTEAGVVLVDSPMRPSDAVRWREEAARRGEIRYLLHTDPHKDHFMGAWFFPGVMVSHRTSRERLARENLEEVMTRFRQIDPASMHLIGGYRVRLADIAFTGELDLRLGKHTFRLLELPGHSEGLCGVYLPEERVVFASDCVFYHVRSALYEADPAAWLESLRRLNELDVDAIVPGHGSSVCKKDHLAEQTDIIRRWVDAVRAAKQKGMGPEEAVNTISCPDPYPMIPGAPMTAADLDKAIIHRLYRVLAEEERTSR